MFGHTGFQVAIFKQGEEDFLCHIEVIFGVGGGENVVTDAKFLEKLDETRMIVLVDLFRRLPKLVCLDRDGCTMRIRTADHQHIAPAQAVIPGYDISRQMRAGDIPNVDIRIGIRPGNGDQNILSHGKTPHKKIDG